MGELLCLSLMGIGGAIAAGALAGMFGLGGAVVIVPVLSEIFRAIGVTDSVRVQLSAGTSLAVVAPAALLAHAAHRRARLAAPDAAPILVGTVAVGVCVGCAIAAVAPAAVFKAVYVAALLVLIGTKQLFRYVSAARDGLSRWPRTAMLGLFTGLLGALTGTGGEPLATVLMMKSRQPIYQLLTGSTRVVALITGAGAVGYVLAGLDVQSNVPPFSVGFVSPILATVMVPFITVAASQGAKLGRTMPEGKKDLAFGVIALIILVRMLVKV
jgi:uncharacterized protein